MQKRKHALEAKSFISRIRMKWRAIQWLLNSAHCVFIWNEMNYLPLDLMDIMYFYQIH